MLSCVGDVEERGEVEMLKEIFVGLVLDAVLSEDQT